MRIVTHAIVPPIPIRGFDWSAYDDDNYSPCMDMACSCHNSVGNAVGYGPTREDAIADLMEQIEIRKENGR